MEEFEAGVEELELLIFKLQEARHTTQSNDSGLIDSQLSSIQSQFQSLTEQFNSISPSEIQLEDYERVKFDYEQLTVELDEEKFNTVFRNVQEQACQMMDSCEKIIDETQLFIKQFQERNHNELEETEVETTFFNLFKSLRAKIKYYSPATTRVLKSVEKLLKTRTSKNGSIIRQFAASKDRWNALSNRIERTLKLLEITARDAGFKFQEDEEPIPQPITPSNLPRLPRSVSTPIAIKPLYSSNREREKSVPPARPIKSSFRNSTSFTQIPLDSTPKKFNSSPSSNYSITPATKPPLTNRNSRPPPSASATANLSSNTSKPRWNGSTRPIKPEAEPKYQNQEESLEILIDGLNIRSSSRMASSRSISRMSFSKFNSNTPSESGGKGRGGSISPTFSTYSNATTNGGTSSRRKSRTSIYGSSKIPLPSPNKNHQGMTSLTGSPISTKMTSSTSMGANLSIGKPKQIEIQDRTTKNRRSMLPVSRNIAEMDGFAGRMRASTSMGNY